MQSFIGQSADECWRSAGTRLIQEFSGGVVDSRAGEVREILHATMAISDPRQRWVLARTPGLNPAFAIVEAIWILAGRNDASFVNFWNPALPRFTGGGDRYAGAYGRRLRTNFGVDQIERAIDALDANPLSRQVVLQIWDGALDLPSPQGGPSNPDVPCNLSCLPKVRDGKLYWLQVLRSNDLIRGTPYNIVQFTVLQEFIAGCLGLDLGEYMQVSDSLHVYVQDLNSFSIAGPGQAPSATASLLLGRREAARVLREMVVLLERLSSGDLTIQCARKILSDGLPAGYGDFLAIAAADSARRRGWGDLQAEAADGCTDPLLKAAWTNWSERKTGRLQACAAE